MLRDLATNMAEAAEPYLIYRPVKALIDLPGMGEIAQQMLASAQAKASRKLGRIIT